MYAPTVTQKHTRSFFISWDEIEPQRALMSRPVHTGTDTHGQTHRTGYLHTHTSQIFLSFTTQGHGKTLWFLINYGSPLWGSTFITYDRSSEGTIFQLRAEIEMKEIVWLEGRQRPQFRPAELDLHMCQQKAYTACDFTDRIYVCAMIYHP